MLGKCPVSKTAAVKPATSLRMLEAIQTWPSYKYERLHKNIFNISSTINQCSWASWFVVLLTFAGLLVGKKSVTFFADASYSFSSVFTLVITSSIFYITWICWKRKQWIKIKARITVKLKQLLQKHSVYFLKTSALQLISHNFTLSIPLILSFLSKF